MGWILPTIVGILGFTVVLPIVVIVAIKTSNYIKRIDVSENAPFIILPKSKVRFTGHALGIMKKITPCPNCCTRFEFFPIDYKQGDYKPIPSMKCVIVKDEFHKPLAEGDLSPHRTIIKVIEPLVVDLPDKLRESKDEREREAYEGQKAFIKSFEGKRQKAGHDAMYENAITLSSPNIDAMAINRLREEIKAKEKALGIEDKK